MSQLVSKALDFARLKHKGHKDDSGLDYFTSHLQQVYFILKQVTDNEDLLAAAYLHDTLEDTATTYEELVSEFGKKVADLVAEVSHEGQKDNKGYYFPRLHSREGVMLKFADRLSNLSRMDIWVKPRQEQYLKKSKFWNSEI